ncbi:MAG: GNAT family N-acetyltransferase [Methanobacteriaceae archaeon]|nr:GNAT family N-acetyltransferase [Methanobacteriaceae archaeon]MDO9628017.1 GNAT family N-acetyltransferase [Methanobacteriaceae archaeon]
MSIKAAVKEHFQQSPIAEHWAYFFPDEIVTEVNELISENNGLEIRKFNPRDLDNCTELFKKVFSSAPWYDDWNSLEQAQNYLSELIRNPAFEGFVACEGSNVVAVCLGHNRSWWNGQEFFVDEFFVENEMQGNGIGTKLLDEVSNYLICQNYIRLTLLTNKEIPAEAFYLKNGFYNNIERTVMVKEL